MHFKAEPDHQNKILQCYFFCTSLPSFKQSQSQKIHKSHILLMKHNLVQLSQSCRVAACLTSLPNVDTLQPNISYSWDLFLGMQIKIKMQGYPLWYLQQQNIRKNYNFQPVRKCIFNQDTYDGISRCHYNYEVDVT